MAIFGTAPGTVGKVMTIPGQTLPAIIRVPGLSGVEGVAITSIGFNQSANVQFMHSLSNLIYVYSFGERMGSMEVNGITFYRPCSGRCGIGNILGFYQQNSVSIKSALTSVTIADNNIRGFVQGMRSLFSDPDKGVLGFSISLATIPGLW